MPKEAAATEKSSKEQAKTPVAADPESRQYLLVPSSQPKLEPVRRAVEKLQEGIIQRFNSSEYVTLAMHVNINSAKADLIPIPHPENLQKLKDRFESLPRKVQEVLRKNIPQDQAKALEEIYEYFDKTFAASGRESNQEAKAIEAKGR